MNRRELLACIAALTTLPAIVALDERVFVPATDKSVLKIDKLWMQGVGRVSEEACVKLCRDAETVLLDFSINAFGGLLRWWAPPGSEFYFIHATPLLIPSTRNVVACCWGQYSTGEAYVCSVGCSDDQPLLIGG